MRWHKMTWDDIRWHKMTVIIINRHACPLIASFSNHRQNLEIDMFQVENHVQNQVCFFLYIILYNPIFETCYLKWFDPQRISKTSNYFDVHPPKNGINRYWSIPIYIYIYIGTSYFLSPPLWIVGSVPWRWSQDLLDFLASESCTVLNVTHVFDACEGWTTKMWIASRKNGNLPWYKLICPAYPEFKATLMEISTKERVLSTNWATELGYNHAK